MSHIRVLVLRGGPSEEYTVSMQSGANVLDSLARRGIPAKDIVVSRAGEWLDQGIVKTPEQILATSDTVFVALHGAYGEDGEVQKILQRHSVPFTGSRSLPAAISFNKHLTKATLRQHGIKMPAHLLVTRERLNDLTATVREINSDIGTELVIKPTASGSSLGVRIVRPHEPLAEIIQEALEAHEAILVEGLIRGREATMAVLDNFRNESTYVFPAIEIVPPTSEDFFTYDAKYGGRAKELCPGKFSYQERERLNAAAALVHQALGLSQYSRSDFIVRDGIPYFLEVNTHPGLTRESLYPKAAEAVGLSFDDLVSLLIETATR